MYQFLMIVMMEILLWIKCIHTFFLSFLPLCIRLTDRTNFLISVWKKKSASLHLSITILRVSIDVSAEGDSSCHKRAIHMPLHINHITALHWTIFSKQCKIRKIGKLFSDYIPGKKNIKMINYFAKWIDEVFKVQVFQEGHENLTKFPSWFVIH